MIAAIGDIHGNLPALEAVLAAIREVGVEEIWCHGDICYAGPWPRECAELIRSEASVVTSGNTDDLITADEEELQSVFRGESGRIILEVSRGDRESIGEELCGWLKELPAEHLRGSGHDALTLTHATRRSNYETIPAVNAPDDSWLQAYGPAPGYVVCGHNHRVFEKRIGRDLVVVNTGSVGAPADGDWRAALLLIEKEERAWSFTHRRVDYDREKAAKAFDGLGHREAVRYARRVRFGNDS